MTAAYRYRDRVGRWLAGLVVLGALAKSCWELASQGSVFDVLGGTGGAWTAAVEAHIAGWLGGVLICLGLGWQQRQQRLNP